MPPKKVKNIVLNETVKDNKIEIPPSPTLHKKLPSSATPFKKLEFNYTPKLYKKRKNNKENETVENKESEKETKGIKSAKMRTKEDGNSNQKKSQNPLSLTNKLEKEEFVRQPLPRNAKTGVNMSEGELAQNNIIGERLKKKKKPKKESAVEKEKEN